MAALHKASDYSQKTLTKLFNDIYDLVQGMIEQDIFNPNPDTTPKKLVNAIKEKLNLEYQPAKNANDEIYGISDVALGDKTCEAGQLGSSEPHTSGEPAQGGEKPAEPGAGAPSNSGRNADKPRRTIDNGENRGLEENPQINPIIVANIAKITIAIT